MARHRDPTLWRTQNFLHDPALVARLVAASDIEASDVVYDLGAGTGSLTAALAQRASHVVAIEKDHALVAALRRRFAGVANVVIREADMFAHPMPRAGHVVFASPPFDRTAELMRKLTAADVPPHLAYLVLQREAAERYIGKPRRTLVAALLAPQFAFEVVHRFARDDFAPSPHVAVVLLRGQKRAPPLVPGRDTQFYRDLVVASFVAGVTPLGDRVRPSELSAEAWLDLYRRLRSFSGARRVVAGAEARLRRQQQRLHRTHRTRAPRDALGVTFSGLRHDRALLVDVVRHEYRGTGPDRKGDPVGGTAVQRGL